MNKSNLILAAISLVVIACTKNEELFVTRKAEPKLPETPYAYKNQSFPEFQGLANTQLSGISDAKATLGRVLFYDTKLSVNNAISCGSCHKQSVAFADVDRFSTGFRGVTTARNSQPVFNAGMGNQLFWDLRAENLTDQVLMPAFDHVEMGMSDMAHLTSKIEATDYYAPLFEAAFGTAEVTEARIRSGLQQFLRSMLSLDSKYDRSLLEEGTTLVGLEALGFELYSGKARCQSCHGFRDLRTWGGANIGLEMNYTDKGMGTWTEGTQGEGVFKIPTLRNIALTAPYMHDGRFATLDEVIEHYNSNIQPHPNLDMRLRNSDFWGIGGGFEGDDFVTQPIPPDQTDPLGPVRMGLTQHEKSALKAFLMTLTDHSLITDPKFSDPFMYE